jgi:hypothetical protein
MNLDKVKIGDTVIITRVDNFDNSWIKEGDGTVISINECSIGIADRNGDKAWFDKDTGLDNIRDGLKISLPEENPQPESAFDKQEGGNHYKDLAIQPMTYALENKLNYAQANVVKYVTRYKNKNGIEDLKKAIHTLELLIEHEAQTGL